MLNKCLKLVKFLNSCPITNHKDIQNSASFLQLNFRKFLKLLKIPEMEQANHGHPFQQDIRLGFLNQAWK